MNAGAVYFPLKGLAKLYMRKKVNGVATGPLIEIYAAQNFEVTQEQDIVEVPGNDVICFEFANFKKFSIPINFGAIRMDQLEFFLGGTFVDGETVATFVERVNYSPTPCEIWVQTDVAAAGDNNARYYEHYPNCVCLSFNNPRATAEAVVFAAEFSGYADANGVKRTMVRDLTGVGIPNQLSGDTTPPTVLSSTPAHDATVTVAPTSVAVNWSEAMNKVSAETGVKLIAAATGQAVAGQSVVYAELAGPVYRSTITAPALANGDYWVMLSTTCKDVAGNFKADHQVIKFTVNVP